MLQPVDIIKDLTSTLNTQNQKEHNKIWATRMLGVSPFPIRRGLFRRIMKMPHIAILPDNKKSWYPNDIKSQTRLVWEAPKTSKLKKMLK